METIGGNSKEWIIVDRKSWNRVYELLGETEKDELKLNNNPFIRQVGGDHYQKFTIQPDYFCERNKLSFIQGSAIKHICRARDI